MQVFNKRKISIFFRHPLVGVKKVFGYYVLQLLPFLLLIKHFEAHTVLRKFGYYRSLVAKLPVGADGGPIPWFTYPAIEYLKQLDLSQKSVFEFGSGNSSRFFSTTALAVYSIEDDREWFIRMSQEKSSNQTLIFAETGNDYINAIQSLGKKFDVILVDGSNRFECIKQSVSYLNPGGMIILDNSDWFPKSTKFLRDQGFIQVDFIGMGPLNGFTWSTSVFLHRDFNFVPRHDAQPKHLTAGVTSTVVEGSSL